LKKPKIPRRIRLIGKTMNRSRTKKKKNDGKKEKHVVHGDPDDSLSHSDTKKKKKKKNSADQRAKPRGVLYTLPKGRGRLKYAIRIEDGQKDRSRHERETQFKIVNQSSKPRRKRWVETSQRKLKKVGDNEEKSAGENSARLPSQVAV